jgi:nucleoside-diphosphate-sugar epimerase
MKCWCQKRFTSEIAVRIIADVAMVNAALLIALALRYLWETDAESIDPAHEAILYAQTYLSTFWGLTLSSIVVFFCSGFYTHSRFYRGRYKALVIVQAVSFSYLIFGLLILLFRDMISFPRSSLLVAWFLTLVFVLGVRLRSVLWSSFAKAEKRLLPAHPDDGEIRNVLVIGGAGYIGSALVQRLLELGYHVRVFDLLLYGDGPIAKFYGHSNFELMQGDFRNIHMVVSACRGMDAIVHLGAIVGDSACAIDEDLTIEINLRATRTIAEVGKGFGVKRFVFASTCSVYGASDEILDEKSKLRPISLYARTKVESEKVVLSLADSNFAPTILRFGTVYGLSGRPRFDLVVNLLAAKAVQDGEVGIFGGQQWRPLVHVRDVAEAISLALQAPLCNVRGQIFNVGCNQQNYQIADLGPIIKDMVPTARVVTQPNEDNRNYRVRFDRICETLNFQPRYGVRDGIQEIVNAFAMGKITNYRDPHYNNFSFLKQNNELRHVFLEDVDAWSWVKLSTTDAAMLTEVVMAAIESGSPELLTHLRESLISAILGDVDTFLNALAGTELVPCAQPLAASAPGRRPALAQPWLASKRPVLGQAST